MTFQRFSAAFFRRMKQLGVNVSFHGLRDSYASILLRAGTPLKVASEALGLSSVAITADLYTHVLGELQRDATDRLATATPPKEDRLRPANLYASMVDTSGADQHYNPRQAMQEVINGVKDQLVRDDVIVQWQDGEHVRLQYRGNIARVMMLGPNLAIANGDSGMPAPLALDGKITDYNVKTAVGRVTGFLTTGY